MKIFSLGILLCLVLTTGFTQSANLDFEELDNSSGALQNWNIKEGQERTGATFHIDSISTHSGHYALRIDRSLPNERFVLASISIPINFKGNKVDVSGWLKAAGIDGRALIWVRLDDAGNNVIQNFNYPTAGFDGTRDWTRFNQSINLPEEAATLYLGCILVGTGQMWADDFAVTVDGKPLNQVKKITREFPKALNDNKEFAKGSGITLTSLTNGQQENLVLLGKIWGFLKYYHPAIANGNYNWDYELFRFLPRYLSIDSKDPRNQLLDEWIQQLDTVAPCKKCSNKLPADAVLTPALGWLEDKALLGNTLSEKLLYIRDNRFYGDRQYYMALAPGIGNPQILHEDAYAQFSYPDAGYRLLSLYRYWNLINYWFPDKHLIGEDWDQVLAAFVPRMIAAPDQLHYLLTTRALIARIHDTHANLWSTHEVLAKEEGTLFPPVRISFVDSKPVVSQIVNDSLARLSNLQRGDVITSIDGRPIDSIIQEWLPQLPASNYPTQLRDLAYKLLRSQDTLSTLQVVRDGQNFTTQLVRFKPKNMGIFYKADFPYQADSSFFMIRPGIGYINLGTIRKTQVDSVFKTLEGSRGLIIDDRQYPGNFAIFEIAQHLVPKSTPFVCFTFASTNYPGVFVKGKPLETGKGKNDYYKGKVIVLVDENTQSSAEYHSLAFRTGVGVSVLGSTTAGADGNVSGFYLPGGIRTMFSGIGVLYPDGRETQRVGIVPDIEVHRTVAGIKAGRDELVEKAVEEIEHN